MRFGLGKHIGPRSTSRPVAGAPCVLRASSPVVVRPGGPEGTVRRPACPQPWSKPDIGGAAAPRTAVPATVAKRRLAGAASPAGVGPGAWTGGRTPMRPAACATPEGRSGSAPLPKRLFASLARMPHAVQRRTVGV